MRLGVMLPLYNGLSDPGAIAEFAQAAEQLGYDFLCTPDNVLDVAIANRPDWDGPTGVAYHDPFAIFAYLAGVTRRIELWVSVLVLPQRQTALVAKQAAEVDILSRGRLRLGVGVGWSEPLFQAMNEDYHTRGARIEEQIAVLRALWTQEVVTFHGRWHHIEELSLRPLPVQRPIPIWWGGHAESTLRRVATIGDGWLPLIDPDDEARKAIEKIQVYARAAGRDPWEIGISAGTCLVETTPDEWRRDLRRWRALGATQFNAGTMGYGETPGSKVYRLISAETMEENFELIRRFKAVADEVLAENT